MPTKAAFSHPVVRFAIVLVAVACLGIGLVLLGLGYVAGQSTNAGPVGLIIFIVSLVVLFHRLKRDVVCEIVQELRSNRGDG